MFFIHLIDAHTELFIGLFLLVIAATIKYLDKNKTGH